jgi:hypothetical protein
MLPVLTFPRQIGGEVEAVDQAIRHCFARHGVVPERKLIAEALKRGIGTTTVEQVLREAAGRPLGRNVENGATMVRLRRD